MLYVFLFPEMTFYRLLHRQEREIACRSGNGYCSANFETKLTFERGLLKWKNMQMQYSVGVKLAKWSGKYRLYFFGYWNWLGVHDLELCSFEYISFHVYFLFEIGCFSFILNFPNEKFLWNNLYITCTYNIYVPQVQSQLEREVEIDGII